MIPLLGKTLEELRNLMTELGEPAFRGEQLYEALYRRRVKDLQSIPNLPAVLRDRLSRSYSLASTEVAARYEAADGTVRYLIRLVDRRTVECVLMPEDGVANPRDKIRHTICLSTQAGCAVDCQFCLTAQLGLQRNLTAGEIVGQVLLVAREQGLDPEAAPVNLVFMGQGEPLLNFDNVMTAVRILADQKGVGLTARRMTLSTAGIVPGIAKLGLERVRPRLAVSLNASHDEQRNALMPINRKWPIATLLAACRDFPLGTREHLTFEYVLLGGLNDRPADARRVVKLLANLPARVNLIPWNPGPSLGYATPDEVDVLAFQQILRDHGLPAFIRRPRGREIYAACGQLSLMEQKTA